MNEKYLVKKRNNATNKIQHMETVSTPPTPTDVYEKYGAGKYLVFVVKKGIKGIRKFASFGIDQGGKIIEKGVKTVKNTPTYIKQVTPSIQHKKVLIKSEIIKKNGKRVRRDYYRTVPISATGMPSEVGKEKIEVRTLEGEKVGKELEKTIVPVDIEGYEARECLPYIMVALVGLAAISLGISAYQQVKK